jgi:hypothetical protein
MSLSHSKGQKRGSTNFIQRSYGWRSMLIFVVNLRATAISGKLASSCATFPWTLCLSSMKQSARIGLLACCVVMASASAFGQLQTAPPPVQTAPPPAAVADSNPVPLEWTPPALTALMAQATVKNSFTLDRNLIRAAAQVYTDSDEGVRQAVNKLDGVSVHTLRFGPNGVPDEAAVNAIREAYHLRGWKHLVTTTSAGGPVHNDHTDVWMVLDGVNVRGAVILAETPRSVTLVTVAGNLSPVDILHLRGKFGIPKFDDGGLHSQK